MILRSFQLGPVFIIEDFIYISDIEDILVSKCEQET